MTLTLFVGVVTSQAQSPSVPSCAVTPALLGGQGFTFKGQGFTFKGQGFTFKGQGFTFKGQGFTFKGQGFTFKGQGFTFKGQDAELQAIIDEVITNPITLGKWVDDRLEFFLDRLGFNSEPTALLIVDEFNGEDAHGTEVQRVVQDSIDALNADLLSRELPAVQITIVPVDISALSYSGQAIASAIASNVDSLRIGEHPFDHFVINMSFGLIACSDPGDAEMPPFDFNQALQVVQANSQPNPTLGVIPVLECVKVKKDDDRSHYSGDDYSITAYFGYQNLNAKLVTIPIGDNNKFLNSYNKDKGQPNQFEPGQQHFVFAVSFSSGSITWSVRGPDGQTNSATANKYSKPCPDSIPSPTLKIVPVVDCVADQGSGMFEAHFGYTNPNQLGQKIAVGTSNKFSPGSQDRGQVTTFVPGEHHNVFEVYFDGSPLTWRLNGLTVTASSSSPGCAEQQGFGIGDYLTQNLGVSQEALPDLWKKLASKADEDDDTGSIRALLRTYLHDSGVPGSNFTVVPVASSGNLRPFLGNLPLAPASWIETIAVGASLDDNNTMWSFSQDGQVLAPGAGYPFTENEFGAGTSFSAPAFSVLAAMCSTVPHALQFGGTFPPIVNASDPKALTNAPIGTDDLGPLACTPNRNPVIDPIGPKTGVGGTSITPFYATATDPDGDQLTFSATGLPPGISISSQGLFTGLLPAVSVATDYTVMVTVKDNGVPEGMDSTSFTWTVTPAVTGPLNVKIDIKPLSPFNHINLRSRGILAVAILGSRTFDAGTVDPRTVTLAGAPVIIFHYFPVAILFDINRDGYRDLIVTVRVQDLQLNASSTEAVLNGRTYSGQAITGKDKVTIVPPHAPHHLGPYSGSTMKDHTVTLDWEPIDEEDEANTCYQVVIASSTSFNRPVQTATVIRLPTYTAFQLANGSYYWRVAVSDCAGNPISPWSDTWGFSVKGR